MDLVGFLLLRKRSPERNEPMARMCGILQIPLREGESGHILKVAEEDVKGDLVNGKPVEPGQYFCCEDAWVKYAPRAVDRLKKTPAIGNDGKPVLKDGKPVMTLPIEAKLASIDPRLLM